MRAWILGSPQVDGYDGTGALFSATVVFTGLADRPRYSTTFKFRLNNSEPFSDFRAAARTGLITRVNELKTEMPNSGFATLTSSDVFVL